MPRSNAVAINASGQVTGSASIPGSHPATSDDFITNNGVMQDIDILGGSNSIGVAINDAGQLYANKNESVK